VSEDWFKGFLRDEDLPPNFQATLEAVCRPLADHAEALREAKGATAFVGLCGAQGSGKSTICAVVAHLLRARGVSCAVLSLDDVYLGREARQWLADQTHPLLAVRGPPGTHDVALACAILDGLAGPGEIPLPRFDKASDERRPPSTWNHVDGPVDVVLFEGWCVGARPQPALDLLAPVNDLERQRDLDGGWRRAVNRALAGAYQALFDRLDTLVLLAAPGFDVVQAWRTEQEHKLIARTGDGMTDAEIAVFIQHYERLTRWILTEMPARADWIVRLDADRRPATSPGNDVPTRKQ
jgi:D-glycerate 3-kinase